MDNYRTLYNICYDVLYLVTNNISNVYNDDEEIFFELFKFLTTNGSQYESVFDDIDFEFIEDKNFYKKIMMLTVFSDAYYLALYQCEHNINTDINISIMKDLEELCSKDVINMFYDYENNPNLYDYIVDYLEFVFKNYIFKNGCMASIIMQKKLGKLLKINPFELINFIDYIEADKFLTTERYIQEFIDTYDSAISLVREDEEYLEENDNFTSDIIQMFKEKIVEHYDYDEDQINEFYSYIFSNIYETLIVLTKVNKQKDIKLMKILQLFNDCNCQFEELYICFMNDDELAKELIDFFIFANNNLYEEDLIDRRNNYIQFGNVEILKQLNPYYEEENIVFQITKSKTKEYNN